MKINKKRLIIIFAVCIILLVIVYFLIVSIKRNSKNATNEYNLEKNKEYVEKVDDIKTVYNVNKCINNMLEDYYIREEYKTKDSVLLPRNLVDELDFENGEKTFYVEKTYKAEMESDITVYFAKGYIVNEGGTKKITENTIKKDIDLILIIDSEYNVGRIALYNKDYKNNFKYNEDISKTEIVSKNGLKVNKNESEEKTLDAVLLENKFFQNKTVDQNIPENDLVNWYYTDYLIKMAEKNNDVVSNLLIYNYDGNFNEGYRIVDRDLKEIVIKPSQIPMEYEVIN